MRAPVPENEIERLEARVGLPASETPRDLSFCAHAVASNEPLVVDDTLQDIRFASNPLVTSAPNIRFYAGVPLILDDGLTVGTLLERFV